MGKQALSWLTAALTAGAVAALAAITQATASGPDLGDPWLSGLLAGAVKKGIDYLIAKLGPAHPPTDTVKGG